MPAILTLLAIGAICAVDSANKNAQVKRNYKRLLEQGAFLKRDYEKHKMIFHDFWMDWFDGDRSYFPKAYHAYFERNPEAAKDYISALTSAQEIKEGRQPIFCVGLYDKSTYDPFSGFNYRYKEKIEIFNETGKMYL